MADVNTLLSKHTPRLTPPPRRTTAPYTQMPTGTEALSTVIWLMVTGLTNSSAGFIAAQLQHHTHTHTHAHRRYTQQHIPVLWFDSFSLSTQTLSRPTGKETETQVTLGSWSCPLSGSQLYCKMFTTNNSGR